MIMNSFLIALITKYIHIFYMANKIVSETTKYEYSSQEKFHQAKVKNYTKVITENRRLRMRSETLSAATADRRSP